MEIIIPEYPDGKNSIEMMLVEMLTENRSWCCIKTIGKALHTVRNHARKMQLEQDMFLDKRGSQQEQPDQEPL